MMSREEPKEAFPYRPPPDEIKAKYKHIFNMKEPLKKRYLKIIFDKTISAFLLFLCLPILIFLKLSYIIEGILIQENKGNLFFYYHAVSQGKTFNKYKIRLIKEKFIDKEGAKKHEWSAFSAEWSGESRTITGAFVKKWYLDEIPQFWSVLKGDMSIVGPRPLAVIHYKRDLQQGNISRKLLKGGLLGLGHINKGTSEMGNAEYEYEYIDNYINSGPIELLKLDILIIWKGIKLILKGGGY